MLKKIHFRLEAIDLFRLSGFGIQGMAASRALQFQAGTKRREDDALYLISREATTKL